MSVTESKIGRKYGCKLSRTELSSPKVYQSFPTKIPKIDLRSKCPPVFNQLELGSCTANASLGAYQYIRMRQGLPNANMSRLWLYYQERRVEDTLDTDSGAAISDGIGVLSSQGVPLESLWPYDICQFSTTPSIESDLNAVEHTCLRSIQLNQSLNSLKQSLIDGYPFVFGFMVYESFESEEVAASGLMHLPKPEENLLGGHAVVAVGYDDSMAGGCFLIRNSWGIHWGIGGYFWMPYKYILNTNLCSDFWQISRVSDIE